MKHLKIASPEVLKRTFRYDPETGYLYDLNKVCGYKDTHGHLKIYFRGCAFQAHRLVWVMHNGPIEGGLFIDHINGKRDDNRIENLRLATNTQNLWNAHGPSKNNKSGFKGVNWDKVYNKWKASISANGKRHHLGYFSNPEDAGEAYRKAAKELHGDFASS